MNISQSHYYHRVPSNDSNVGPLSSPAASTDRLPTVAPPRFFLRRDEDLRPNGRLFVRGFDGEMNQGIGSFEAATVTVGAAVVPMNEEKNGRDSPALLRGKDGGGAEDAKKECTEQTDDDERDFSKTQQQCHVAEDSSFFLRAVLMESGSLKEEEKARGMLLREEHRHCQQGNRGRVINNDEEGPPPTRTSAATSKGGGGLDELMARIALARRSSQDTFSSPGAVPTTPSNGGGGGAKGAPDKEEAATTPEERSVSPANIAVNDAPAVRGGSPPPPPARRRKRPLSLSDFIADSYDCDGIGDKMKRTGVSSQGRRRECPLPLPSLLPETTTNASPRTGGRNKAVEFTVRPRYDSPWLTSLSSSSMENPPPKTIEVERGGFK
mmetsp:Transcript_17259/g.50138  ORF Transcript_17259/g.50138 Transcript_17259/m.50138 type:complete len:381 (-) Transcript_17259:496-1638(-)